MSNGDGPTAAATKAAKIAKITKKAHQGFVIFVAFVFSEAAAVGSSRSSQLVAGLRGLPLDPVTRQS
jgi:hypothetical protein